MAPERTAGRQWLAIALVATVGIGAIVLAFIPWGRDLYENPSRSGWQLFREAGVTFSTDPFVGDEEVPATAFTGIVPIVAGRFAGGKRMAGRVGVVALVAVMASFSLAAAEPTDGDPAVSRTTVRAKVHDANISIRYPKNWVAIPLTQDAFDSMKKRYVETDPKYRWIFRSASLFRTTLVFRASDVKSQIVDGQQSFLTVQVYPASSTLKTFAAEHSKPFVYDTEESTSEVELFGHNAYRTDLRQEVGPSDTHLNSACYPLPSGGIRCPRWNNHVARLFFRRGSKLVFIAMGCLDDVPCRTLIDETFASVRPTH